MTAPGRPATAMAVTAACFLLVTLVSSCGSDTDTPIPDEAKRAGRGWETLKAANEDYYADMDRGMSRHPDQVFAALPFLKTPEQAVDTFVKGRNNWIVWTAGNDTLWNYLSGHTFGALDFLKTLSTHDALGYGRNKGEYGRWKYFGLVNEPCFEAATGPDPKRFGLWLDQRRSGPDCPPDPFEDDKKYPGVVIGARGQNLNLPADKKQLGWPDAAGRFLLRLRDRRRGAAAVPEPRFRRGGGGEVGSGPLLQRPQLLREQGPGAAVSRRHVVRLLPRRAEPDQSAGRSREPEVGEPDARTPARSTSGSIASSSSTRSAHPATSRFSCSTPTCRGRSTPRWSRATTSTTPAR